ncbi:MAG: amino acid ABC transporter permease [Betaproteobacteria bacterium]|nr:amino acid ABC transporter permease [Betaproteobacteria bacterium]
MNYNWNWGLFFQLVSDTDETWLEMLVSGLGWTLAVSACAWIVAFSVGSLVGVLRTTSHRGLARVGDAYVELFRNVPLLVQFFLWYFVLPGLSSEVRQWVTGLDPATHQFFTAILCLGLFTAARIAEQVRSGIQSLSRGQRQAGYALGLTQPQTYRHVLLPMAYRIIIPPLTSELMNLIKNSSVALTIGLTELTFRTREMGEVTFAYFEAFTAATVIYVIVAMSSNRVMAWLERRVAVPGYIGGPK